jgi:NAD-dependent dihydropyrimidine dehydrogenase PreA subunit
MNPIQEIPWLEKATTIEERLPIWREHAIPGRINLYHIPWLRSLLKSRWPQFLVRALALASFVFVIAAGLIGSAVGGHNFAIIFVWVIWWTALKLVFIPFGGRSWCSICPIPLPGEWLQHGGILEKSARPHGLNLRWPKRLKGSWLQSIIFLVIGLFSALTLTDPGVTGWVLLALFGLAIALSLVFERRAFCSYICPIGGFTGIYAQTAPVELRVIDTEVCAKHGDKSCYHACPWGLYPVAFRDNTACGLCMECLRACPQDNLALNLRPFGTDIGKPRTSNRLDEAFLALIMLGSALAFAAVFVGPWGWLKSAAFAIGSFRWVGYAAGFLVINLLLLPGLFALATWAGQKLGGKNLPTKRLVLKREIANQSQALLPLGLMAWIAFTVSFALPKLGYVADGVNDPFGWGWNLLGAFYTSRSPDVSRFSPVIQVGILLIGLFWSAHVANRLAVSNSRRAFPIIAFCLVFSLSMLWLLIG